MRYATAEDDRSEERQQLVPKLDVVRAEAQVVEAESLVKESETAYLNLLANLSYIAGGMEVVPMEETLHVPVFDVAPGLQKAWEARPDVRATSKGEAHHWLRQLPERVPFAVGRCPQKYRYFEIGRAHV